MKSQYSHVDIRSINIDDDDDLGDKYEIEYLPTFVLLKDKVECGRTSGISKVKIMNLFKQTCKKKELDYRIGDSELTSA